MKYLLTLFLIFFASCGTPQYYSDKYRPPAHPQKPNLIPHNLKLQEQIEGHTCGLHALSTIYTAHGMDAKKANLRFRLGVDKAAIPLKKSTKGTLHPDLYRVASQDGFETTSIDPRNAQAERILENHFRKKRYAMCLIKIPQSTILHWVVLESIQRGKITIFDSISEKPYSAPLRDYLHTEALSIVLLEPLPAQRTPNITATHKKGIIEMNRVLARLARKK